MYPEIEEGNVGAVVVGNEETDGYYLVEWVAGSPFFVEISVNNTLMCSGIYWNPVKRTPKWCTRSDPIQQQDHLLKIILFILKYCSIKYLQRISFQMDVKKQMLLLRMQWEYMLIQMMKL